MTEHFSRDEMTCKCGCGRADMHPGFMEQLEALRVMANRPLVVLSGYRCPKHNDEVSNTGPDGPHTTGKAVDIVISGAAAYDLLILALALDFSGVGVAQHGQHSGRFIHLDYLARPQYPRPMVWSY